jgi:2,3-dihydroxybiphenyl 1,2-dioxygenase
LSPRVSQLGYLVFEVSDPARFEHFATEVLGLTVGERTADGGFTLRMDNHRQRFFVRPGPLDDVAAVGWQVDDATTLDRLVDGLSRAGVSTTAASEDTCAARGVRRLVQLQDPHGLPLELCVDPRPADGPFVSSVVPDGFCADTLGLGHVVVAAADRVASMAFYRDLLGFTHSDDVVTETYGFKVHISFMRCNPRHHSLAVGPALGKRIHHFMIEARDLDAVGLACDRALKNGIRITQMLGRHPNDRMLSFYALTPAGFSFEFGWGGLQIADEAHWQPAVYDRISDWGHHPPRAPK